MEVGRALVCGRAKGIEGKGGGVSSRSSTRDEKKRERETDVTENSFLSESTVVPSSSVCWSVLEDSKGISCCSEQFAGGGRVGSGFPGDAGWRVRVGSGGERSEMRVVLVLQNIQKRQMGDDFGA